MIIIQKVMKPHHWLYILGLVLLSVIGIVLAWVFLYNNLLSQIIATEVYTVDQGMVSDLFKALELVKPLLDYGLEYMTQFDIGNSSLLSFNIMSGLDESIVTYLVTNLTVIYNISNAQRELFENTLSAKLNQSITITDYSSATEILTTANYRPWYCPITYISPISRTLDYLPGLDICNSTPYQPILVKLNSSSNIVSIAKVDKFSNQPQHVVFGLKNEIGIVLLTVTLDAQIYAFNAFTIVDVIVTINNQVLYADCGYVCPGMPCDYTCLAWGRRYTRNLTVLNANFSDTLELTLIFPQAHPDMYVFYYIVIAVVVFLIIAIITVFQLATKRHHIEAANEMLGYINHELRNPLNAIKGMIDIVTTDLRRNTRDFDMIYSNLGTAKNACEMMSHIINDILDFKLITEGKVTIQKKYVTVSFIERTLFKIIEPKLWEKPQLSYSFNSNDVTELYTDEARILQILLNFVANSIKFTDTGYIKVEINKDEENKSIRIAVIDSGRGIEESDFGKIFKPYEQSGVVYSLRHGGIGLGLYLCKMLSQLMKAEIGFTSEYGKGSEFWLQIPNKEDAQV